MELTVTRAGPKPQTWNSPFSFFFSPQTWNSPLPPPLSFCFSFPNSYISDMHSPSPIKSPWLLHTIINLVLFTWHTLLSVVLHEKYFPLLTLKVGMLVLVYCVRTVNSYTFVYLFFIFLIFCVCVCVWFIYSVSHNLCWKEIKVYVQMLRRNCWILTAICYLDYILSVL